MKKFIKKIIRDLYWKYGHDGDPWQTRLVVYHLGNIISASQESVPSKDISGRFIFAQLEENMNKIPKTLFNPIADIKIGGCIE